MAAVIVDTVAKVKELIEKLENWSPSYPFLFIDLEGINLSRTGSISILQLLIAPEQTVYLLDIHNLKHAAFHTASEHGLTLHQVLEDGQYPKIMFDVRMDSDALFAQYQVSLRCVVDLQLLEFITRQVSGTYLSGLAKCIERDAGLTFKEVHNWNRVKEAGRSRFAPERGGKYEVFNERPLEPALADYCVQDVKFMPTLLLRYAARVHPFEAVQVQRETAVRISQSQDRVPLRKGRHMAIGPRFTPIYMSTMPVKLSHPMDIICSSSLKSYCEQGYQSKPNQLNASLSNNQAMKSDDLISNASLLQNQDPPGMKASTSTHEYPQLDGNTTATDAYRDIYSSPTARTRISGTQNSVASGFPSIWSPNTTTEPTLAPSRSPVTVSRALQQLSNRKTPDFTLSNDQCLYSHDREYHSHDSEDSDRHSHDLAHRLDQIHVSPQLALSIDQHGSTGDQMAHSLHRYGHDTNDDDFPAYHQKYDDNEIESESPKDYTACSAEDCGYCGHCSY